MIGAAWQGINRAGQGRTGRKGQERSVQGSTGKEGVGQGKERQDSA